MGMPNLKEPGPRVERFRFLRGYRFEMAQVTIVPTAVIHNGQISEFRAFFIQLHADNGKSLVRMVQGNGVPF
jgi:hypothetical protein